MKVYHTVSSHKLHDRVQLLLPWYVNNTLTKEERRVVEEHCSDCALCGAEQSELQKMRESNRQIAVPEFSAAASFNRLMARIDKEAQHGRSKRARRYYPVGFLETVFAWAEFLPPKALVAALVLLFCLVPSAMLLKLDNSETYDAKYRTLSNANSLDDFGVNDIRVIFADNIDANERARLIALVRGEIVAGPSPQGLYLIRIGAPADVSPDIAKAIEMLRREAGVLFAERALPQRDASSAMDIQT